MLSARRRAPCDSGEWLAVNKYSWIGIVGAQGRRCNSSGEPDADVNGSTTVSYTHLTLPTIYSV